MLLHQLGDDILELIAKAMVTPSSTSPSKVKERHFHDLWNFSRCNKNLHDLLWPPDQGYWQQICNVHGSGRLFPAVEWRKLALQLMREEKKAAGKKYFPRPTKPGFLMKPPDWAVVALGPQLPPSPSFWDRPVIAKADEWNIERTQINDPTRLVMPDCRLLSMPGLTTVEVLLCSEIYNPGKVLDRFTAHNAEGLIIGDIDKAFAKWLPTATSPAIKAMLRGVSNNLDALRLLEAHSTPLLRTWPFATINGGRTLAMLEITDRRYRHADAPANVNHQVVDEINDAYGEDDDDDDDDDEDDNEDEDEEEGWGEGEDDMEGGQYQAYGAQGYVLGGA